MTTLAVFVVRLMMMVLALRMLGFVAALTAVACQRCTAHCEYRHCSKDKTTHRASHAG
jgi:hypothetical protein